MAIPNSSALTIAATAIAFAALPMNDATVYRYFHFSTSLLLFNLHQAPSKYKLQ